MQSRLMYVELKSGYSDNGPAWIGKAFFSKTGRTVYFNGQALKGATGQAYMSSGRGLSHFDSKTGDSYWVTGIKKEGTNRHWAGSGKIMIDKNVVDEYLKLRNLSELAKNRYEIVELDNTPNKQYFNEFENEKLKIVNVHPCTVQFV